MGRSLWETISDTDLPPAHGTDMVWYGAVTLYRAQHCACKVTRMESTQDPNRHWRLPSGATLARRTTRDAHARTTMAAVVRWLIVSVQENPPILLSPRCCCWANSASWYRLTPLPRGSAIERLSSLTPDQPVAAS